MPSLWLLLAHLQKLRDTNDTTQRRSKLVADVAQELALRQVRGLGLPQRRLEAVRRAQHLARNQQHNCCDSDHQSDEGPECRTKHRSAWGGRLPGHPRQRADRRPH